MADGKVLVAVPGGATKTFKANSATARVLERLKDLYGVGDLLDADGDSVVENDLCAGSYVYTLVPELGFQSRAMAEERVWVRFLDSTLRFRCRNGRLDADEICKKWKLDPESLVIGPDAIAVGDDGLSKDTVVEIRQAASEVGAGDGKSQHTPFLLEATPSQPSKRFKDEPSEPQAPAPISLPPTPEEFETRIVVVCNVFTNGLVPEFQKLPRDEGSYEMKFPSSRAPVCTLDGKTPSLLWDSVPLGDIVEHVRMQPTTQNQITMFLAPSGSGKTRNLIEEAVKETSLFFVGKFRKMGGGQGSGDIHVVADHLEKLYGAESDEIIPHNALKCCVAAMLTSRLHLLTVLKKLCPNLTQREWTFFQLEYATGLKDVFSQVTKELLNTFVEKDERSVVTTAFERILWKGAYVFQDSQLDRHWSGQAILDEAQIIDQLLPGRFVDDKGVRRSLLHSFLVSLAELGFGSIYIAGTGESLLGIKSTAEESGSLKRFKFRSVYSLPGFSSAHEMEAYMSRFIDTSVIDAEKVYTSLGKRRRFIATALESYMMGNEVGSMVLLSYGYDVCTRSGSALGLLHSLKDDVVKFLTRHKEGTLLRKAALAFYYTGMPALVTGLHDVNELLNCSLGEFVSREDINEEAGFEIIHSGARHAYGAVKISEPLVVRAILLNIPEQDHFAPLLDMQRDPSGIGTVYSLCCALGYSASFNP